MDADGVPIVGQSLDLKLLEPLQHKRTLAYINHFIIQMTGHLNKFACQAEGKLAEVDRRTQQIQTTLLLLEAKLASIPDLAGVTLEPSQQATVAQTTAAQTTVTQTTTAQTPVTQTAPALASEGSTVPQTEVDGGDGQTVETPPEPVPEYTPVSKDYRYAKYFKMVAVGIPPAALHAKMQMEGLDPIYLDNPDQPAPPPPTSEVSHSTDTDSDSSD